MGDTCPVSTASATVTGSVSNSQIVAAANTADTMATVPNRLTLQRTNSITEHSRGDESQCDNRQAADCRRQAAGRAGLRPELSIRHAMGCGVAVRGVIGLSGPTAPAI